jgi:hypothetical protein
VIQFVLGAAGSPTIVVGSLATHGSSPFWPTDAFPTNLVADMGDGLTSLAVGVSQSSTIGSFLPTDFFPMLLVGDSDSLVEGDSTPSMFEVFALDTLLVGVVAPSDKATTLLHVDSSPSKSPWSKN